MKRFLSVVSVVLVFLVLSCASSSAPDSSKKAEAWIDDPYTVYPESEYLCAIGFGDSISEAESNAINGLVAGFSLDISSTVQTSINEMSKAGGSKTESSYANDIIMKAEAEDLFGVQILQRAVDRQNGKNVALAVLRKSDASSHYRQLAEKEKAQLALLKMNVSTNIGKFSAVRDAEQYRELVDEYNTNASIYNYLASPKLQLVSKVEADRLVRDACSSISASIAIEDDAEGNLSSAISSVLTDRGFRVADADTTVRITGSVQWSESETDQFKFANYVVDISVTELSSGDTLFVYDARSREGHTSYESAKNRAIKKIAKAFDAKLNDLD